MNKWIYNLILIFSISALSCNIDGTGGFAPENSLNISANTLSSNGVTEEVFNEVIDEVSAVYRPIVEAKGHPFRVDRRWSTGKVNASASMDRRGRLILTMYGGLARHELMTRDGFATVLCHEIGHYLGGAPKRKTWYGTRIWASNEGQSDYFAIYKCFKRVYGHQDNISFIKDLDVPSIVKNKCESVYTNENDSALCIRSVMAAKAGANLLASIGGAELPSFDKVDSRIAKKTNDRHPPAQCRLDNYFAASLCNRDLDAKLDTRDPNKGICNRIDGDSEGLRSLCWYKPYSI